MSRDRRNREWDLADYPRTLLQFWVSAVALDNCRLQACSIVRSVRDLRKRSSAAWCQRKAEARMHV